MEENNIVLSIITPVYNTPLPFFKEYLHSIKSANIQYPYEILIINDGSTNKDLEGFIKNIFKNDIIID